MSTATLRIVLAPLDNMLADARLRVELDGAVVHDGGVLGGFEATRLLAPGAHTLTTVLGAGVLRRRQRYTVHIPAAGYRDNVQRFEARLEYSMLWGNFTRRLALRGA